MRRIIPLFVVLAVGLASARPSGPCALSILRAPPDVRATVESWVERETTCRVALEVRIIPTEGGLYLFARDDRERIYERIVPDAQSAGVLVASWMADDTLSGEPAPAEPAIASTELTMSGSAMVDVVPHAADGIRPSRWLMVEGMLGGAVGGSGGATMKGVRADFDVVTFGNWNLGASASFATGALGMDVFSRSTVEIGTLEPAHDLKAVIYAVRPIDLGSWHARPAFGLGALVTNLLVTDPDYPASVMPQTIHNLVSPIGELSFVVSRDLGPSWAMHGGIALDLTPQTIELATTDPGGLATIHRRLDLELVFGLGRRL